MLEKIITKILAQVDDLPSETLQRIQKSIISELSEYDIAPKSKDLVPYTGTPQLLKLFFGNKEN